MERSQRYTYKTYGEVLTAAADRCFLVEVYLRESSSDAKEPWDSMVEAIADAEHELAAGLREFADEGPEEIVSTQLQYTLDVEDCPAPDSVGAALKQVMKVNDEIETLLSDQVGKLKAGEVHDEVEQLRNKVEAVGRKISMIRVSAEDL